MCFEPTLCDGDGIVERRDDGYYGGCRVIAVANGHPRLQARQYSRRPGQGPWCGRIAKGQPQRQGRESTLCGLRACVGGDKSMDLIDKHQCITQI